MKFKRRSDVVEAEQFDGTEKEAIRLCSWVGFAAKAFPKNIDEWFIEIYKGRTTVRIYKGNWIVREVDGEFNGWEGYGPNAFDLVYERAE